MFRGQATYRHVPLRSRCPLRKGRVESVNDPARQRRAVDALGRVRGRQDGHAIGVIRISPLRQRRVTRHDPQAVGARAGGRRVRLRLREQEVVRPRGRRE